MSQAPEHFNLGLFDGMFRKASNVLLTPCESHIPFKVVFYATYVNTRFRWRVVRMRPWQQGVAYF